MDIKLNKTAVLGSFGSSAVKIGRYYSPLAVKVEILIEPSTEGPKLSICGEVGRVGGALSSAGQITDDVVRLLADPDARLNYPADKIAKLLEVWDRWHLNNMRAGCEHQRAAWDTSAQIVVVTHRLKSDVLTAAHKLEEKARLDLTTRGVATVNPEELALLQLPWEVKAEEGTTVTPSQIIHYREHSRETKTAGWVYPSESARGLLGKPCPTCGYKYGSRWLYEPLPADVVAFLRDF